MAHLLISSGPLTGHELPLKRGSNLVGRTVENDVVIDDPTLSSRHCEIVVSDSSVRVRDLGSDHGTWIDGQRILSYKWPAPRGYGVRGVLVGVYGKNTMIGWIVEDLVSLMDRPTGDIEPKQE